MHRQENEAFDPPKDLTADQLSPGIAPRLKRVAAWFERLIKLAVRLAGLLIWGSFVLFFLVPPVILLILLSVGGYSLLSGQADLDYATVLLTATGTTAALAALCFSYSRAVEQRTSKHAGLTSGRMLLGATVALSVAMAAYFLDTASTVSAQAGDNAFRRFVIENSLEVTLMVTPLLVCLAVLRMYVHLIRLAGIAFVHTHDSREGRAEREELRIFD